MTPPGSLASRAAGQTTSTVFAPEVSTVSFTSASWRVQGIDVLSTAEYSHARTICGALFAGTVHESVTFAPGVHLIVCAALGALCSSQLRSGPIWPCVQGAVT